MQCCTVKKLFAVCILSHRLFIHIIHCMGDVEHKLYHCLSMCVFALASLSGCIKKLTCVFACVSKQKRRFPPLLTFCFLYCRSSTPIRLILLPPFSTPLTYLTRALCSPSLPPSCSSHPHPALVLWPDLTKHCSLSVAKTFPCLLSSTHTSCCAQTISVQKIEHIYVFNTKLTFL